MLKVLDSSQNLIKYYKYELQVSINIKKEPLTIHYPLSLGPRMIRVGIKKNYCENLELQISGCRHSI